MPPSIVLAAAGDVVWCDDESMLDAVTGVSGSGPAYVFYCIEALEAAANELGFAPDDATHARVRDVRGRGEARARVRTSIAQTLRAQVTSKGGTTERGIAALEDAGVEAGDHPRREGGHRTCAEIGDAPATTAGRGTAAMIDQAIKLVVDVAFGLIVYALIGRFLMQLLRAPFRNPIGQAVMALTDWLVKPLRKILPGFGGIDWASLVGAFVFQLLWLLALYAIFGRGLQLKRCRRSPTSSPRRCSSWSRARCGCSCSSSSSRRCSPGWRPTARSPGSSTR